MVCSIDDEDSPCRVHGSPWIEALLVMGTVGNSSVTISSTFSSKSSDSLELLVLLLLATSIASSMTGNLMVGIDT